MKGIKCDRCGSFETEASHRNLSEDINLGYKKEDAQFATKEHFDLCNECRRELAEEWINNYES